MNTCASCGVKEGGAIKLKKCAACHLVSYCGVKCQKDHRPKHKHACKKRAAELHEELLFRQPERIHLDDCPICFLPSPIGPLKSTVMTCCSQFICKGCAYGNYKRAIDAKIPISCPYCRKIAPSSNAEREKRRMARVEANDPVAMSQYGMRICENTKNYPLAFRYLTKAAKMGDSNAHHQLAVMYENGQGVEKDMKKRLYHFEQAAIGGHPYSRYFLGMIHVENRQYDKAVQHWIIACKLGLDDALKSLKLAYQVGWVSKEQYDAASHGHQVAVDATKSEQRKVAEEANW